MKYLPIFDLVTTTNDLLTLKEELELLQSSLYKSKGFELALKTSVREKTANALRVVFTDEKISFKNTLEIKNLLEQVQKTLAHLPILRVTIAISPSENTNEKIRSFFQEKREKKFVLDVTCDPTIIGGAIISYDGKFKDYSIKKNLENYFETKKEEVKKLLS